MLNRNKIAGFSISIYWKNKGCTHIVSSVIVKNSRVHPFLIPFMKSPFSHILENLNIPYPYKDWDEGEDTLENRRTRYKNVNSEMAFCYFINVVISLVHLVPMLLTGLAKFDIIYIYYTL